ncbi:MAG: (Fe-S)-binding protein [Candidatus Lokiarchaeota archaeon]|nr:(Fe-S)-binding protein [Candidatus Lokiarchaeota archaeon]
MNIATDKWKFRRYDRGPFKADRCTKCGICFNSCPVVHLSIDEAKVAISALVACQESGHDLPGPARKVLASCTTCMACNVACPNDCRPTNLVQAIWHGAYKKEGLPVRAKYFVHHEPVNFRTHVVDHLPREERAMVESWRNLDPVDEMIYPGCSGVTMPYLFLAKRGDGTAASRLFDGMVVRGSIDNCCGETYFRSGLFDVVEQVAKRITRYLRDLLKVKRVVCLCNACGDMLANILPQFGADTSGIEVVPLIKVLHDKLRTGELQVVKRFDGMTATIQEACHAKIYEAGYYGHPRAILEMLGFKVVEARHAGDANLCCGIGYGFSRASSYSKLAIIKGSTSCLRNVTSTGTDIVCTYCAGCQEMFSVVKSFYWTRKPIWYITELIQLAIGEEPVRRHESIGRTMLAGSFKKQQRGKKRFFVPDVSGLPHSKF